MSVSRLPPSRKVPNPHLATPTGRFTPDRVPEASGPTSVGASMIRPDFPARTVLVIPALNETGCVGATVARWRRLGFDCIRVVDNGSTDDTAAEARTAGAEVLREPQRGYGAAAWRGLQHWPADRTWVLFSSADGSDQLSEADLIVWQQTLDSGVDLVLGDRTASDAARRHLKWIQRFGNQVQCWALAWGWGHRFRDMRPGRP